jgi:hypothetical protein
MWYGFSDSLPHKHSNGKFIILIIPSAKYLRWPYTRKDKEDPKYDTRKDAEKIIKAYIRFANNRNRYKRFQNEFQVIDLTEDINKAN